MLALWDSPRQREAYEWFSVELANLRAAFRWSADHGDLDTRPRIAFYAGVPRHTGRTIRARHVGPVHRELVDVWYDPADPTQVTVDEPGGRSRLVVGIGLGLLFAALGVFFIVAG